MTHHSGLIHILEVWICTRIEERRHIDLTIIIYKSEVIDKDNVKKTWQHEIIGYEKEKKERFSSMTELS